MKKTVILRTAGSNEDQAVKAFTPKSIQSKRVNQAYNSIPRISINGLKINPTHQDLRLR